MQLRIIPLNVVEEKVHAQLFPEDGNYVTWIRANNPDYPEFEAGDVKLHLFYLEEDEWPERSLIVPKSYESQIREKLRNNDGFGDYNSVYVEIDIGLLLPYTEKRVSIVRQPRGQGHPTIHLAAELDGDTLIKGWIEAGMPEPWCS